MEFWIKIFHSPLVSSRNIIIGRGLNFTLGSCDIWGSLKLVDPLADLYIKGHEDSKFLDIQPIKYVPTWRKMHFGDALIDKRLEIFLIYKYFMQE
jgi:hypothetical protein